MANKLISFHGKPEIKKKYLESRVSDLEESREDMWIWIVTLIVLITIIGSFIGVLYDKVNDLEQSQVQKVCVNETYLEKVNYSCNETVGYNYCDRIYLEKTKEVCHYE